MISASAPRRPLVTIMLAALIVPLVPLGCRRQDPAKAGPPPAVEVAAVSLRPQRVTITRELPGRTSPLAVAEVRPQVTGLVRERLFTEGGLVQAGQPLYQLDDGTYATAHRSAQAAVARAEAALELARLNARRSEELAGANAVSRQEHENAVAALRQSEAELGVAQAAAAGAAVTLGYTRITAPIAGRIGRSMVTVGALVTANQATPLATVQQLDPIYVDVTQTSREWLRLREALAAGSLHRPEGMDVTIVREDGSPHPHRGRLAASEVTVDPSTGSFALRIVVPNPDESLLPGMYVRAVLALGVREDAILVPQRGIARDPKGNAVAMVVTADNTIESRTVAVSQTVGDQWLVESGLAAGERVVVEGLQKIRPGAAVRVAEPAPAAAPSG